MEQINENQISNIFRLSSVLFAEGNYTIKPRQLHQKVIENALSEMNVSGFANVMEISDFIEKNYNFFFTDDEIWKIVSVPKLQDKTFIVYEDGNDRFANLSITRKQIISNRGTAPNIEIFIEEYTTIKNLPKEETRNLIYRFLYSVFTSNAENFKRLINNKDTYFPRIDNTFSDQEKQIINDFLNWESIPKDKAIFNVASFALEYCLLTNTNNTSITIESLRNKEFFLDTNIIYRALGINGELRQRRTISILKKFRAVGESLHISKVTAEEFKNSVSHHCQNIQKYNNPAISSELYNQIAETHRDFYTSYQSWRSDKVNSSIEMYQSYLLVQFEEFLEKFQVVEERFSPYDGSLDFNQALIDNYKDGILRYKRDKFESRAKHDAQNILWIENKRNNEPTTIFESKCFLLSSDHRLQAWDYNRNSLVPVVFLPSQWLSITLRFISRTNDDFSSFVSFLNLPYNEKILDNDQIMVVLSGISEYATDYSSQSKVYFKFIETHISKEIDLSKSDSASLYSEAKIFAKSEIEKELEETKLLREADKKQYEKENLQLKGIISDQKEKHEELFNKFKNLEREGIKQNNENLRLYEENKSLKEEISERKRHNKFWIWTILMLLMAIIVLMSFAFQEWEHNYIAKIIKYCEELGGIRSDIISWLFILVLGGVCCKWWLAFQNTKTQPEI